MKYRKDLRAAYDEYRKYQEEVLMPLWDEYAIKKTIEHDRQTAMEEGKKEGMKEGMKEAMKKRIKKRMEEEMEEGMEEGIEKKSYEVVENLLSAGGFSISKIANLVNVTESFVRKVKKGL
jgi:flagellar biosynthesis/type III secretory pathway protein FliH